MIFKRLFLAIFLLASFQIFAQQKYSKVRIFVDKEGIQKIQNTGISLNNVTGKSGLFLDAELSDTELKKLSDKGINYKVLIEDVSKFYAERYAVSAKENKNSLKGINYVTPVHFNYGSMGGFLTLSEVYDELDEMASLYPNLITTKFTIGNTQTIEGRSVYAIKISDNPNVNEDEPEVLYTSLIHAREPESMQQLIWYMWYLLENYGTDDEITYLVDNLQMYFIPVVNPDGYEYNHTTDPNGGGMWRKNKRDNNSNGTFSEYDDGVDLNRNFGFQWGYDNSGSSPDPSSATYRGSSAFSEPETQIIRDFTNQHEFLLAHNHHTYSGLIIIPWGYETIHTPDDDFLRTSAHLMASENGYTVGQGWEILYTVNGDSNDWMYGEQTSKPKIMAYTQETGESFWPSQSEIIPLCEDSYLSNLYLARFATPYAELSDNSPNYISRTGYLKFNLKRMGLSGSGHYTVTITPDNSVFQSLGSPKNILLYEVLNEHTDSIAYTLSNDIQYGDEFTYTVTVSSDSYSLSKELTKSYYETEIILEDSGDDINNWTTSAWSVTDENYHSAGYSITDSQGGNYLENTNSSITLTNGIDLSGLNNPQLSFWAKWNIENNWDYVQFLISTNNGSTWIPVQTSHTNAGTGSFQPNGEPLYDGSSNWVEETLDLSSYVGQTVKFRFELHSDVSVNEDGYYFDDFKIIVVSDVLAATVSAEAGCGSNSGKVTVYSTQSGNQTFYLRDDAGNPVDDWTGDAAFHIFEGLPDGIYRGQVEKDGTMSSLSDVVVLTNVTVVPNAPTSVTAGETNVCSGSNTVLSYTGGSGDIFTWYTGSCGGTSIGNGNDLSVLVNTETTYYGRWENVCGTSDCEQITIGIIPETNITSQPQDVNATAGEDISFSVIGEGDNLSYQWRKNTSNIPGAADATYIINNVQISDAGSYDVTVSGTCGTLVSDAAVLDVSLSVNSLKTELFNVFPNPSRGSFKIVLSENLKKYTIEISDISGRKIYSDTGNTGHSSEINFKSVQKGIYFIIVQTLNFKYVKKMVIN